VWDMEVRSGVVGPVRLRMGVEEHGGGKQLVLVRCWPRWTAWRLVLLAMVAALSVVCLLDQEWVPAAVIGAFALTMSLRKLHDQATAQASLSSALDSLQEELGPVHRNTAQPIATAGRSGTRDDALTAAAAGVNELQVSA
jgi:hypothetical protein